MKILDRYLLKTYLITFTSVFVILFFIFILQTVWLFISELAGKDLDLFMIIKFLLFASPKLVPMVLPLSVLLSSIMTFGDLAENYEFAAMKSAGISFQRTMKGLSIFIILLSFCAFFFANNVIPYAEYKFINFRKNIAQVKPALAIAEGQFSNIGNINIKVDKKTGEKGEFLENVTIHKKSNLGEGAKTVIKSKKGHLLSSEESNLLQLILIDGYYYEDITPKDYKDRPKMPFAKVYFKKYNINIDLSKLNSTEEDKSQITNTNNMLSLSELKYTADSLSTSYNKEVLSVSDNVYQRFGFNYNMAQFDSIKNTKTPELTSFLDNTLKSKILEIANSDALSSKQNLEMNEMTFLAKKKDINNHWLSMYEKFVIAYACLLMFFIGAPLGAIIRKGGLGLPIVFAMLIFITFHFLNTFGKKLAQESGTTPFMGAWISSMVLTPLAIYLTKKAINDNGDVNFDFISEPFRKLYDFFTKKLNNNNNTIQENGD
ncbi:LptF/LptG family permease [Flavobacterium terrae]|uniref:Lipopolysaccharide export system permease protein n=1 Tax=Flavobacterium terrae TaxID=415425 RepID=A0A1M6ETB9_9FLAO|nr:LptF/LptG family permease [Flavobacterium terrae]SHI88727.1 lipopolysaccharide export system permease protein [Flavobacterium terrae]